MERVAVRGEAHLFLTDFKACNAYADGLERASALRCPVQIITGRQDAMTPPRASRALIDAMKRADVSVETVTLNAGHALMSEQPDATLSALFSFATRPA